MFPTIICYPDFDPCQTYQPTLLFLTCIGVLGQRNEAAPLTPLNVTAPSTSNPGAAPPPPYPGGAPQTGAGGDTDHNLSDSEVSLPSPGYVPLSGLGNQPANMLNEHQETPEEDEVLNFYLDMLFSGMVQCAQKLATQHGACQALLAFWKHAMGNYHQTKKVKISNRLP